MDEYLQCPYDPSHRIIKKKMQVHLSRCRRNHKHVPKALCPFNNTHLMDERELECHVQTCPNRENFESFKHRDVRLGNYSGASTSQAAVNDENKDDGSVPYVQCAENWDEEPPVPTYNPEAYCSNAPVLRKIEGATPSQRREFRAQEQKRLMSLNQNKN